MGSGLETAVLDFHAYHARKLAPFTEPPGNTVGQGQKAPECLLPVRHVFGKCGGIANALCFYRSRNDRGVINAVGVLPQKKAVAFQVGDKNVPVTSGQIPNGYDFQIFQRKCTGLAAHI